MSGNAFLALLAALSVSTSLAAAEAQARSDQEIQAEISGLLIQRHPKDDRQWWRALGPGAPSVIIRMFESATEEYEKHRLIGGLGWFGDDARAVEYLKRVASGTDEPLLSATALRAEAAAEGPQAVDFISKFLTNEDGRTRLAAGRALKSIDDPRARDTLARWMKEEKAPWVVAGVRGDAVQPLRTLAPVSSSEDARQAALLSGRWSGLWLDPQSAAGSAPPFKTREASLVSRSPAAGEIQGELRTGTTVVALPRSRVKASKFSGALPDGQKFDAEIREESGQALLELRFPRSGATLLLRKDG